MYQTFIERPVFNLLEFIYALVPGHDLGVAIILFTVVIRLIMWPLVKKQLHHSKAMRKLQPELKKIKQAAKGDRQKEARLQMELYKEHEIKPFATIGTLLIQIPIFIALYHVVNKIIKDPGSLQTLSYDWVRDLSWIQQLAADASKFDTTFLGIVDLSRLGIGGGGVYFAAIILAAVSAFVQYHQSKMMMIDQKDSRKLSAIMKEAAAGKEADQSEVTAAVSRSMIKILPLITFLFAVSLPAALSLYILTTSAVGYLQQRSVLQQDQDEMQEIADKSVSKPTSGVKITHKTVTPSPKPKTKKSSNKSKKRRK